MSQLSSMKQYGIRNMNCVVELMEWSNKMDLVAYATDKGEVIVQRLNWQKIVTFPAPDENVKVRSISWQLDETVIALGYSNGKVNLVDVETELQLSRLTYDEDIKNVYFSKAITVTDYRCSLKHNVEFNHHSFLPELPALNGAGEASNRKNIHKSFARGAPCFLVILLKSGKVHLLLLGALKSGTIDIMQHVSNPDDYEVYDVRLSGEFNALYALVRDGNALKILHFHNSIMEDYMSPMLHVAEQCALMLETKNYINDTIHMMLESWETVLIEMDNKLTKYANSQPEAALSADLLELLVFDYASNEIEEFLMEELTEKGVRKLANTVDISYSTIQNLVSRPLQTAAINMFYFLNTTHGLGLMSYYFEDLICPVAAQETMRLCGTFLMKINELQQIIDQCVYDMKLFFQWLCVVIVRLRQQDLTEDMKELSIQDAIYLAEYLNSFEDSVVVNEDGTVTKRKFNLEKVGQYLENKNLQQITKADAHDLWNKLLEENACMRNNILTFPHDRQSSLVQQRDKLFEAVDMLFTKPHKNISNTFTLDANILCTTIAKEQGDAKASFKSSFIVNESKKTDLFVTTINEQELLLLEFDRSCKEMFCLRIQLQPGPLTSISLNEAYQNLKIVCLQFYNENVISLLLRGGATHDSGATTNSYFVQCLLEEVQKQAKQLSLPSQIDLGELCAVHNIFDITDVSTFKTLDGVCTLFSVSASRKVASVLSDQQKKMAIFEMEVDDDEDETDMSHASVLEISKDSNISGAANE